MPLPAFFGGLMKKGKNTLWDKTDVKVFILCLLDELHHPMTYTAIVDAVIDTGYVRGFDFAECFSELEEFEHIWKDTLGSETYYMISDSGTLVARELRSSIAPEILERVNYIAAHHLALASLGVVLNVKVTPTEDARFRLSFEIRSGERGELLSLAVTVSGRQQAEQIKEYCEKAKPEDIYRAVLSVVTGEIHFLL